MLHPDIGGSPFTKGINLRRKEQNAIVFDPISRMGRRNRVLLVVLAYS